MEIDSYQQCPCQSGKKIKFCCGKDLVSDLNQVLSKHGAGQSIAAIEHIDRTIGKVGVRDCLLTIKTHILITLGEIEKARQANTQFLEQSPDHVTGLHHRALIEMAEGKMFQAVETLQDSMDAITGNEIPLSLSNAFRLIGVGLLSSGHLLAGRAHLTFALELKNERDDELTGMISQTFRSAEIPLLLKNEFRLPAPPAEDSLWYKKYVNVTRALARGQFRKALKFLNQIDGKFPDQPQVVQGIAIVSSFLGHPEGLADNWRRWARHPETSHLDAVEAEAIGQLVDEVPPVETLDVVRLTFAVSDGQQVSEVLASSSRLKIAGAPNADPFGEGPPPKSVYFVLDRDAVMHAEGMTADQVPLILGELLLFGKQTDREARVDFVGVKDERFDESVAFVKSLLGEQLVGDPNQQEISAIDGEQHALSWGASWPADITRPQHDQLIKDAFPGVLDRWSKLKFSVLDGKTAREVVGDQNYLVPLQALCWRLITAVERKHSMEVLQPFLTELQIPTPEKLAPEILHEREVSAFQLRYMDFSKLSNEELLLVQRHAMVIANFPVVKLALTEILQRDDFEALPRYMALAMMAQLVDDDQVMLQYLEDARSDAHKQGQPIGFLLVQEFELRLLHGLTDKLPSLLQTIQMHHLDEPDVEYELMRILQQHGLVDGEMPGDHPGAPPSPQALADVGVAGPAGGIVVDEAAAGSAKGGEPSKLWLPD